MSQSKQLPTLGWSPSSFQSFPQHQKVEYKDSGLLEKSLTKLRHLPPLVSPAEVDRLLLNLEEASKGMKPVRYHLVLFYYSANVTYNSIIATITFVYILCTVSLQLSLFTFVMQSKHINTQAMHILPSTKSKGKKFVLQGGDCAEMFEMASQQPIENKLKVLLQMSLILTWGGKVCIYFEFTLYLTLTDPSGPNSPHGRPVRQAPFLPHRNRRWQRNPYLPWPKH